MSTNKMFCGLSGKIQTDLINAIDDVMGDEIKREINKALFIAVIINETTDMSNAAQLAMVLHYATDKGVKEHFGKRADDIAAVNVGFLEEYKCLD